MTPTPDKTPRFSQTMMAILGSALLALVLATLLTGNPLRVTQLAYTDWSHTPAAGAAKASDTRAPATKN